MGSLISPVTANLYLNSEPNARTVFCNLSQVILLRYVDYTFVTMKSQRIHDSVSWTARAVTLTLQ